MSGDGAGAPAAGAPAAPAAAPTQGEATPGAPKPPEPKPWDGIEYTVKGQTRRETDPAKARRAFERVAGLDMELEGIAKAKAELEPIRQLQKLIDEGDETAVEEFLASKMGQKLDRLAERRLARQFEREERFKGMTERERHMAELLEKQQSQLELTKKERAELAQREEETKQQAEQQHLQRVIGESLTETLKAMQMKSGALEPMSVALLQPILKAELESGVFLTPAERAAKATEMLDGIMSWRLGSLEGDALLEAMGPDTEKRYRAALLARLERGSAPASQTQPQQGQQGQQAAKPGGWDPRRSWR